MNDPRYVDDPFEEEPRIPKWRLPKTEMQRRLLQAMGCRYWPLGSREIRSRFIIAEKSTSPVGKIVPDWPTEWFEKCLGWCIAKRKKGEFVGLKGFATLYFDDESRRAFREKFVQDKQGPDDPRYR